MDILNKSATVYLGLAVSNDNPVVKDPNAYGFYIKDGNLYLSYRMYKPEYNISNGNLFTTEQNVSINSSGYLIKEV